MADLADEKTVSIEIPEDAPVTVETVETPQEGKKADPVVDERETAIADLRRQLEDQKAAADRERQARELAERHAREQTEAAKTAKSEVQDSNLRVILNAIDANEQVAANAERSYADAMAAGDYASAAKAQRSMASAEAQLLQLRNGKAQLEEMLGARPVEGRVQSEPQRRDPPLDPVEDMASRLTPKSAAWLRAHPQAAHNVNKITAAHSAAIELEGIVPESDEYFAYIEQRLGISQPKQAPVVEKPARAAMASTPVSSAGSSSSQSGRSGANVMTLSPSEVEIALLNEPDLPRQKALEIYARSKAALIREGKLH